MKYKSGFKVFTGFRQILTIAICFLPFLGMATEASEFKSVMDDAKLLVDGRYRYETVDQDGLPENASAATLRARLGVETGSYEGVSLLVEGEGVVHTFDDNFNSTTNGRTRFPVVADPDGIELNRLQLNIKSIPHTDVTVGRQRLNLANQRYVGAVGFRQNEQTFDAVRLVVDPKFPIRATYIFANQVNRIFGNESPVGEFEGGIHLVHAETTPIEGLKASGFAYFLDLDQAPVLSTRTLGGRLEGTFPVSEDVNVKLVGEYSHQSEAADNPRNIDLSYIHGEGTVSVRNINLTGGVEILEGDGTTGFSTPLATLHKFQGFADAFLVTPANGIRDIYAAAKASFTDVGPINKVTVGVWYHDFRSQNTSADLGHETDAVLNLVLSDQVDVELKYATFEGGAGPASRDKLWLAVHFKL